MELTKRERNFLFEILDKINVQGMESKVIVLQIMAKLAEAEKLAEPEVTHEQN